MSWSLMGIKGLITHGSHIKDIRIKEMITN